MKDPIWYYVIVGAVALVVAFIVSTLIQSAKRKSDERELGRAKDQALQIVNDAVREAEAKKKESILEAKEEILAAKNEFEREQKDRRKADEDTDSDDTAGGGKGIFAFHEVLLL